MSGVKTEDIAQRTKDLELKIHQKFKTDQHLVTYGVDDSVVLEECDII